LDGTERRNAVRRIAREGDPDRTLAALFAPRETRDHLFALYAFNVELARIAEQVSEPGLGAIRLQWWREAIARAGKDEVVGHPVADAVGAAIRERALPLDRLTGLIDARGFDVEVKIMPDRPALDAYLEGTSGALFALAAAILGGDTASVRQAAGAAGRAYGLTGLMRALPVHASKGRLCLPADALARHGTSPEQLLAGSTSEGLIDLLAELRDEARVALGVAEGYMAELGPGERAAVRPLALVDPYLAALEKTRDPLREIADINPLYRLWRLARWR
jgi:15-cis-phytoene synthase